MSKFLGTIIDGELSNESTGEGLTPYNGAFGVVVNEGDVALIYSLTDLHHELPGGRSDGNENVEETFRREIMEEVGCELKNIQEVAHFIEIRTKDGFETSSHFMIAEAAGNWRKPVHTKNEVKRGISLEWVDLKELVSTITLENPQTVNGKIKHQRDTLSLDELFSREDILKTYFGLGAIA